MTTKWARVDTADGVVTGEYDDGVVRGDERGNEYVLEEDAELLAPAEPSAFYCVGRNYGETVDQMGYDVPDEPDFFLKGPTSVHDPGEPIRYPVGTSTRSSS